MNIFRHNAKKSVSSKFGDENDDLTILDPPPLTFTSVPDAKEYRHTSLVSEISHLRVLSETHASSFQHNVKRNDSHPAEQDFISTSDIFANTRLDIVKVGLKGEQERNAVLEEQVKFLSQQAALALDRLSETSKENETLRRSNEELKRQRFSFGTRRQSSTSSRATDGSVFSRNGQQYKSRSKNSSISSTQSSIRHLRESSCNLVQTNQLQHTQQIQQQHEKEMNVLVLQIRSYEEELGKSEQEMSQMKAEIEELKQASKQKTKQIDTLMDKISIFKKQHKVENDYYTSRIQQLVTQIQEKNSNRIHLLERIHDYDNALSSLQKGKTLISI